MTRTFFAVVDAAGEFKRRNRTDDGEYDTFHEASNYLLSLPNIEDYSVKQFTEEADDEA